MLLMQSLLKLYLNDYSIGYVLEPALLLLGIVSMGGWKQRYPCCHLKIETQMNNVEALILWIEPLPHLTDTDAYLNDP